MTWSYETYIGEREEKNKDVRVRGVGIIITKATGRSMMSLLELG